MSGGSDPWPGRFFLRPSSALPCQSLPFGSQEQMSHGGKGDVVVPTAPVPPLVVVQPQLFFEFPVVLLHLKAALGQERHLPQLGAG